MPLDQTSPLPPIGASHEPGRPRPEMPPMRVVSKGWFSTRETLQTVEELRAEDRRGT